MTETACVFTVDRMDYLSYDGSFDAKPDWRSGSKLISTHSSASEAVEAAKLYRANWNNIRPFWVATNPMTAEQAISELVDRHIAHYTYVKGGGCAWCSKREGDHYVSIPGHADGCAIKRLELAVKNRDYAGIVDSMVSRTR